MQFQDKINCVTLHLVGYILDIHCFSFDEEEVKGGGNKSGELGSCIAARALDQMDIILQCYTGKL